MLMELLSKAATIALLSFVVSSMLAMGTGLTVAQIIEPLRSARLVVLSLFANFVLMPLVAFALAKVLWLDEPFAVGLLLLGCAAGAPFLPKLAELAKGNLAFAVRAMVLRHGIPLADLDYFYVDARWQELLAEQDRRRQSIQQEYRRGRPGTVGAVARARNSYLQSLVAAGSSLRKACRKMRRALCEPAWK
jgi:hypothetical protein